MLREGHPSHLYRLLLHAFKQLPTMVMNKKIVVRESAIAGHGLYVVERINKGEVVGAPA
jgi:hypothetical protein